MSTISYDPVSTYVPSNPGSYDALGFASPSASLSASSTVVGPSSQGETYEMHVRAPSEEWPSPYSPPVATTTSAMARAQARDPRFSVVSSYSDVYDGLADDGSRPPGQNPDGSWQAYDYDPSSEPHAL